MLLLSIALLFDMRQKKHVRLRRVKHFPEIVSGTVGYFYQSACIAQRIIELEIAYVPGAEVFKFFLPVLTVNRCGEKEQKYCEISPTPHIEYLVSISSSS